MVILRQADAGRCHRKYYKLESIRNAFITDAIDVHKEQKGPKDKPLMVAAAKNPI